MEIFPNCIVIEKGSMVLWKVLHIKEGWAYVEAPFSTPTWKKLENLKFYSKCSLHYPYLCICCHNGGDAQ